MVRTPRSRRPRRVAIVMDEMMENAPTILAGVAGFAGERGGWEFVGTAGSGLLPLEEAARLPAEAADGFLVLGEPPRRHRRRLDRLGGKVVVVSPTGAERVGGASWVAPDLDEAADLAGEHLLSLGVRSCGFLTNASPHATRCRRRFAALAARADIPCAVCNVHGLLLASDWPAYRTRLVRWLTDLEAPAAVFTFNDMRAVAIVHVARELGFAIPDRIAVAGLGDSRVHAAILPFGLTTVRFNWRRVGRVAARRLHRLMTGRPVSASPKAVPVVGLVQRRSTEVFHADDPVVARALRFVRDHLADRIDTDGIARHCAVSRRALQYRFKAALGHGVHEELLRARVRRAEQLLAFTDKALAAVAAACGFAEPRNLSLAFKKRVGVTPTRYRERARGTSA